MRGFAWISVVGGMIAGAACERDDDSSDREASGAPTDTEEALLAHLPADAHAVFGGSYERLSEHWEESALRSLTEFDELAGGQDAAADYMTCWLGGDAADDYAGALWLDDSVLTVSVVFDGLKQDTLKRCADEAGIAYRGDDDGKYVELQDVPDGQGRTSNVGYYFVDSDTAFLSLDLEFGLVDHELVELSRADFEERLQAAEEGASVAEKGVMAEMFEDAQRSRAFWIAGTAEGTPLEDGMEGGHGWFDLREEGLKFAFTVDLASAEVASSAVEQFEEFEDMTAFLPSVVSDLADSIFENSTLASSGTTLKGNFKVENEPLEEALPELEKLAEPAEPGFP